MSEVRDYLNEIRNKYRTGVAGEHAYRPALEKLLESPGTGLNAVNDPARTEIGMPDYVVLRKQGNVPIGIVEAKDIGNRLNRTEKSEQIKRYMAQGNLILTDYLEFRWYVDGEKIDTVRIANVKNGKITRVSTAYADLTDMLRRFVQQTTRSVNSAQELAERLARSAQFIAHFIEKDLKSDKPSANLQNQMAAFEKTLLPGLDIPRFADMYAQTLAYGLFASRVYFPGDPATFSLRGAAEDIPQTNPFLRDLFYHSRFDIGKRLTWMAESLVEILRHTDMEGILAHFGQRTQQTDPVVHFYETFLSAYNPSLRETRGVYYTPEPVVKYIVRSVDHILKTRFHRPRGLADENALVLDPAAGTGTFLYFVIEQIKEAFAGQQGLWKSYVEKHLLPRIFGFELLMAPYTVAHMNLSLQLKDAGYDFKEGERLGIYLTNSLEEAVEAPPLPFANFIAEEANTAAEIKRDKPIMVVLGNPPYSGHSANKGEWIGKLVRDYYFVDGEPLGERNPKYLQDDYVKFIRFAQWRIEKSGEGVIGFITNNSYLDAPTFRGMRQSLMSVFNAIYILNLHGSVKRKISRDGMNDENVFQIQQGVSIVILIKDQSQVDSASIHYHELIGSRAVKYKSLDCADISEWAVIEPSKPYYLFVPQDTTKVAEYQSGWRLNEMAPVNVNGFKTHRDKFAVAFDLATILQRAEQMRTASNTVSLFREVNLLKDTRDWNLERAVQQIAEDNSWKEKVTKCAYRLFDNRFCYLSTVMMDLPRRELVENVLHKDNLCLLVPRQQGQAGFRHVWITKLPANDCVISNKSREVNQVFPLYLYPTKQKELTDPSEFPLSHKGRRPNLSKAFVSEMEAKLGLTFQTEGSAFLTPPPAPPQGIGEGSAADKSRNPPEQQSSPHCDGGTEGGRNGGAEGGGWFGPEDLFYFAYAIFHSPTYRERYAEFLKIDFPRLPLTSDVELFAALVKLGAELVGLHLMKSPGLSNFISSFDIEGDNEVARGHPKYVEAKQRVYINKTQYFGGVAPEIWDFHIGGYRVAEKWLKDRRGRKLSYEDLTHYQKIIVALYETRGIMSEIDNVIPGFPIE